jgi:hypothetical protein
MKGYFGIDINNNQLGGDAVWCRLIFIRECFESGQSKLCSLRCRKLVIDTNDKETINLNAWKVVVGANCAPFD